MKEDLLESYEKIREIRQIIPTKIKHQDARDYLELVIKNNFLEAQNVQLLLNLQLQARTISQLKSMIMRQQRFIQENHLDSGENIAKVFSGKQFEELEDDEDYKRLLVASPTATKGKTVSVAGPPQKLEPDAAVVAEPVINAEDACLEPVPAPVEELVGLIVGGEIPPEDAASVPVSEPVTATAANDAPLEGKEESRAEDISVTGAPAFKIEGKSLGPSSGSAAAAGGDKEKVTETKKPQPAVAGKSKSIKESKTAGKGSGQPQAQPANLSVMGSKIAAKKGGVLVKGKPK